ncbi:MAG: FtsB family cell division protein [Luteibaculum sp.]
MRLKTLISIAKKRLPAWLGNKYAATLLVFFLFVAFFDSYTFVDLYKWKRELSQLEDEKKYYEQQILLLEEDEKNLSSNLNNIERFAREKYFMKKPNEEIFLIVKED